MQDLFIEKGAKFSDCGNYRYSLWRIWDKSKPILVFIGLNPSTANAEKDDPTIRRVIRFGFDNGYGGVKMLNLFTLISSDPDWLIGGGGMLNPLKDSDYWLIGHKDEPVVFAWGAFKQAKKRAEEIKPLFPNAFCLGKNTDGSPKHPLYIRANQPLIKYR